MTGHDDFDRTLAGWFEADALSPAPADGLDRILDATRRRRPRPAWLAGPGSDWVGVTPGAGSSSGARSLARLGARWSTALILLLVIAAIVGGAILVGAVLLRPSPPPTGRLGHLAYGLDGDIYLADWDGRNPTRIAHAPPDGPADCYGFGGEGPMWSPDGRHLAYRSGGAFCPGATVLISDPAGHIVASFPGTGWLISWSPDSTRVATWVDLDKTIGIYGLDGVRQALLTAPAGCRLPGDFDAVWSPDGTSLVVWPCEVPLDGRTPRSLPANDPRSNGHWAYSPDETRVAYIAGGRLFVAAADGSQERVLVPTGVSGGPVWSPTGDRVGFDTGSSLSPPNELGVVDAASGTVTSLASAPGTESILFIRFSPGGDRILFSRSDANYVGTSLWSVHADGSDAQLLVTGTGWGDWQPLPAGP
jgi:Tol biopolymer transport system component